MGFARMMRVETRCVASAPRPPPSSLARRNPRGRRPRHVASASATRVTHRPSPALPTPQRRRGGPSVVAARANAAAAMASYTPAQWFAVFLGYACIVGSVFRCLPQVHRIVTRKSVEGISFTAILSEFLIYSINLAYNWHYKYPFNTYGDLAVSWFVLIFVLVLMQWYRRFEAKKVAVVAAMSAAWCLVLFTNVLPAYALSFLQAASALGLAFGSRIPQIWLNFRQGHTGELSIIMFIANALGCLIRCFTTLSLTQDMLLLFNASFHFVLNTIIIVQCADTRLGGPRKRKRGEVLPRGA
ncbi:mannose-P-dolichol utilization defect protein [Chloropicon roscoffensis]|uniref:Mannose-P-dolichol utilization defect protein n=1 Tax=Chloropicon roscoffensis TaxID=1461544 RepID=A0AAX4PBH1_9CHLO